MTQEYTREDLLSYMYEHEIDNLTPSDIVTRVCEIRGMDPDKCKDIRIETYTLYAPKLKFEYHE